MARKAPSQVRSDPPHRTPREGDRAVVPGVSARTLVEIARVERHRYEPGAAYRALSAWRGVVYGRGPSWIIYPSWDEDYPCCQPVWGGDHRGTLEAFCLSLPRRAVRELRAVLAPLDARFLARTLPDPYAPPGDPWWRRRLERA
ncbi:hypothetical protein ACE1OC_17005 [Streptomyces sp. DSM 116496]|uniref:hypothetical protein n=1 Tax=Streptomyces stoeckheimensis TaxID=3344656 RepID=UPI0038B2429F